jgi:hypothetical protein
MAEGRDFGIPIKNVLVLQVVKRVGIKIRQNDRLQNAPSICVLGQGNQRNARG